MSNRGDDRMMAAFALVAGLAAALVALAAYMLVVPNSDTETQTLARYEQSGTYSYAVSGQPSALNPTGGIGPVTVEPGETQVGPTQPIFTRLADTFDFTYSYRLQTDDEAQLKGTIAASLEIKAGDDWTQTRELTPPTAFEGKTAALQATIDLRELEALLRRVEEETGSRGGNYTLQITPVVELTGSVGGQPIEGVYSTPLSIGYSTTQITPGDTLAFSEPKAITRSLQEENEFGLFGSTLPASTLRVVLLPLAALALIGAGVMAAITFLGFGRSEAAMVQARYGSLLVPVSDVQSLAGHRISVASVHDLAQLAKRESRSLFVEQFENGSAVYFVHDGLVIYQYTSGDAPADWVRMPSMGAVAYAPVTVAPAAAPQPVEDEVREELPAWLTEPYEDDDDGDDASSDGAGQGPEASGVAVEAGRAESYAGADVEDTHGSQNGHSNGQAPAEVAEAPEEAVATQEAAVAAPVEAAQELAAEEPLAAAAPDFTEAEEPIAEAAPEAVAEPEALVDEPKVSPVAEAGDALEEAATPTFEAVIQDERQTVVEPPPEVEALEVSEGDVPGTEAAPPAFDAVIQDEWQTAVEDAAVAAAPKAIAADESVAEPGDIEEPQATDVPVVEDARPQETLLPHDGEIDAPAALTAISATESAAERAARARSRKAIRSWLKRRSGGGREPGGATEPEMSLDPEAAILLGPATSIDSYETVAAPEAAAEEEAQPATWQDSALSNEPEAAEPATSAEAEVAEAEPSATYEAETADIVEQGVSTDEDARLEAWQARVKSYEAEVAEPVDSADAVEVAEPVANVEDAAPVSEWQAPIESYEAEVTEPVDGAGAVEVAESVANVEDVAPVSEWQAPIASYEADMPEPGLSDEADEADEAVETEYDADVRIEAGVAAVDEPVAESEMDETPKAEESLAALASTVQAETTLEVWQAQPSSDEADVASIELDTPTEVSEPVANVEIEAIAEVAKPVSSVEIETPTEVAEPVANAEIEAIAEVAEPVSSVELDTPIQVEAPAVGTETQDAPEVEAAVASVAAEPEAPPARLNGTALDTRGVGRNWSQLFANGHEPNMPASRGPSEREFPHVPGDAIETAAAAVPLRRETPVRRSPGSPLASPEPDLAVSQREAAPRPLEAVQPQVAATLPAVEAVPEVPVAQVQSTPAVAEERNPAAPSQPVRRRPVPIEQKLAESARKWLREFMDSPRR